MRRELFKRVFFACTCFLILLNIFTPISFAGIHGEAYTSSYIPVCSSYPTAESLPFAEDTAVLYSHLSTSANYSWYFIDKGNNLTTTTNNVINRPVTGFWVDDLDSSGTQLTYWRCCIYSASKIIKVTYNSNNNTYITTYLGSTDNADPNNPSITQYRYKAIFNILDKDVSGTFTLICTEDYNYSGHGLQYFLDQDPSSWGTYQNYYSPYYIAQYPTSVSQAVESIKGNTSMIQSYYNTLNGKLNSLSSDHIVLSNQISELQSQLDSQGGEYQSVLDQAQSEIESNANAAASNAVSEVVNAGEDVSDLDNDVDNVSDIVDTLDGWIESLDSFADHIDESTSGVATALDNGKTLFNGFLGVCPPIIIALFGFALVFLVVRKIIGR